MVVIWPRLASCVEAWISSFSSWKRAGSLLFPDLGSMSILTTTTTLSHLSLVGSHRQHQMERGSGVRLLLSTSAVGITFQVTSLVFQATCWRCVRRFVRAKGITLKSNAGCGNMQALMKFRSAGSPLCSALRTQGLRSNVTFSCTWAGRRAWM